MCSCDTVPFQFKSLSVSAAERPHPEPTALITRTSDGLKSRNLKLCTGAPQFLPPCFEHRLTKAYSGRGSKAQNIVNLGIRQVHVSVSELCGIDRNRNGPPGN